MLFCIQWSPFSNTVQQTQISDIEPSSRFFHKSSSNFANYSFCLRSIWRRASSCFCLTLAKASSPAFLVSVLSFFLRFFPLAFRALISSIVWDLVVPRKRSGSKSLCRVTTVVSESVNSNSGHSPSSLQMSDDSSQDRAWSISESRHSLKSSLLSMAVRRFPFWRSSSETTSIYSVRVFGFCRSEHVSSGDVLLDNVLES